MRAPALQLVSSFISGLQLTSPAATPTALGRTLAPDYADFMVAARHAWHGLSSVPFRERGSRTPLSTRQACAHTFEHLAAAAAAFPFVSGALASLNPRRPTPSLAELRQLSHAYLDLLRRDQSNVGRCYGRDLLRPAYDGISYTDDEIRGAVHRQMAAILQHAEMPPTHAVNVSGNYPTYFHHRFHWMGWFDETIGIAWPFLTEFLFLGGYAAIQRQAIPPIIDAIRAVRRPKILELGAGEGGFARQLVRALRWNDIDAQLTLVDLSPVQVQRAEQLRRRKALDIRVEQANAEELPHADRSFHVVVIQNLFHELPPAARRRVIAEIRRVLKPGGTIVVIDALQGDGSYPSLLDHFGADMNEPHYAHYRNNPLELLFAEAGFELRSGPIPLFLAARWVFKKSEK